MEKTFKYKDKNISVTCIGYSIEETKELLMISRNEAVRNDNIAILATEEIVKNNPIKEKDVEEVSLREILRETRMPKTTRDFKCPCCHQSILLDIRGSEEVLHVVRDLRGDMPRLYTVEIEGYGSDFVGVDPKTLIKNKDAIVSIYSDLLKMIGKDDLFITDDSDYDGYCPVCTNTSKLNSWIDAYTNPLNFDAKSLNLCDVCGDNGEIEVTRTGDSVVCENKCIHKIITT